MDVKEIRLNDVDLIHLVQSSNHWCTSYNSIFVHIFLSPHGKSPTSVKCLSLYLKYKAVVYLLALLLTNHLCTSKVQSKASLLQLLNEKDKTGCSPLHYASREGHIRSLENLIRLGACINLKNNNNESPLHFAAR